MRSAGAAAVGGVSHVETRLEGGLTGVDCSMLLEAPCATL